MKKPDNRIYGIFQNMLEFFGTYGWVAENTNPLNKVVCAVELGMNLSLTIVEDPKQIKSLCGDYDSGMQAYMLTIDEDYLTFIFSPNTMVKLPNGQEQNGLILLFATEKIIDRAENLFYMEKSFLSTRSEVKNGHRE